MPQTSPTSNTSRCRTLPQKMDGRLKKILEQQLLVQECVDDEAFAAAAEIRDGMLRKLRPGRRYS